MPGRDEVHEDGLPGSGRSIGRDRNALHGAAASRAKASSRWKSARRTLLVGGFVLALALLLALNGRPVLGPLGHPAQGIAPAFRLAVDRFRGPVRIGLQVGHLHENALPRELATLRSATGAEAHGLSEVDLNLSIVRALARRLRALGFEVDVLGATVPPGYRATLVLAVHVDASPDPAREGYKSAHYVPLRNPRDPLLKLDVDRAVLRETPLGDDDANVSIDMLEYYAFDARRYRHSVARATPALIVEMGYLTNRHDRAVLRRPGVLAAALADGIVSYLHDVQRIPPGPPGPAPARAASAANGDRGRPRSGAMR